MLTGEIPFDEVHPKAKIRYVVTDKPYLHKYDCVTLLGSVTLSNARTIFSRNESKIDIESYTQNFQYAFKEKLMPFVSMEGVTRIAEYFKRKSTSPDSEPFLQKIKAHFEGSNQQESIAPPEKFAIPENDNDEQEESIAPPEKFAAPENGNDKKRWREPEELSSHERLIELQIMYTGVKVMRALDPAWTPDADAKTTMQEKAKDFMFSDNIPVNKMGKSAGTPITVLEVMQSMGFRGDHETSLIIGSEVAKAYTYRYMQPPKSQVECVKGNRYSRFFYTERDRDLIEAAIQAYAKGYIYNEAGEDAGGAGGGKKAGGAGGGKKAGGAGGGKKAGGSGGGEKAGGSGGGEKAGGSGGGEKAGGAGGDTETDYSDPSSEDEDDTGRGKKDVPLDSFGLFGDMLDGAGGGKKDVPPTSYGPFDGMEGGAGAVGASLSQAIKAGGAGDGKKKKKSAGGPSLSLAGLGGAGGGKKKRVNGPSSSQAGQEGDASEVSDEEANQKKLAVELAAYDDE